MRFHHLTLLCIILFVSQLNSAWANPDSLNYEAQRNKVNNLLDERASKFGDYDLSLEQKTGIFGLFKTKNDMQKSIDILQEIVKADNNIFIETRSLLKIKDQEAEKYQQLADEYDNQVTAYMRTISKLQNTNEKLNKEIVSQRKEEQTDHLVYFLFTFVIIGLLLIIFKQYKLIKTKKLTKL